MHPLTLEDRTVELIIHTIAETYALLEVTLIDVSIDKYFPSKASWLVVLPEALVDRSIRICISSKSFPFLVLFLNLAEVHGSGFERDTGDKLVALRVVDIQLGFERGIKFELPSH